MCWKGSFQYLELCSATLGSACLQCLGSACVWDGTALGGIPLGGKGAGLGHIRRGHEEVDRRSWGGLAASLHHLRGEHWSFGHHPTFRLNQT